MSSLRIVCLVVFAAIGQSAAYGGQNWGYKTEIHHPAKSSYGHGNDHGGGYSHVERYQSPPKYHYETKYEVPSKYHHEEEHYEIEKPKVYSHHNEHDSYHKPKYYSKPKMYYPKATPPPTTPPPKKDDDHLGLKFNFEMPFNKMFDKFGGGKEEPKEEPEPETYGYGYDKKTTTPPPEEDKKEFEIKIPKIDVEKMIPSFKS